MPKALEAKLKREARAKGLTGRHAAAYVYGTLRKTGWTPTAPARHHGGRISRGHGGYHPKGH